jgi:hypothetical protein
MTAIQVYEMYLALKLHFTTKYDYVKYKGVVRFDKDNFSLRNDKYFFEKLAVQYSKETILDYFVGNLKENPKAWIGTFNDENYFAWKKLKDSLLYIFEQDCKRLMNIIESVYGYIETEEELVRAQFIAEPGKTPIIIDAIIGNDFKKESMAILHYFTGMMDFLDKKHESNVIWMKYSNDIRKILPFVIQIVEKDPSKYKIVIAEKLMRLDS